MGGWKPVAMVVRYEHASDERDALLAQALKPFMSGGNVVPIARGDERDRARGARDEREVEGEVADLPPLTSTNDAESSGGETRTLNLAGLFRDNLDLHFSSCSDPDLDI